MENKSKEIKRKKINWLLEQPIETQLEIVSHNMEICRIFINSLIDQEVFEYTGERYNHNKPYNGRYSRWGYNPGSVKIGDEKIRIDIPRVFDNEAKKNIVLEYYEELKHLPYQDQQVVNAVLRGLSMRDYGAVVYQLQDSFGLSSSSISRSFIERSKEALEEFESRKLTSEEFIAIFMDGKCLAMQQMVIALGVTITGRKIPLGVIQTTTENATSIKGLLKDLIERGLKFEDGLLFIIDGSKGMRKAIIETFGEKALIQRCQWHKRENVVSYLNEEDQQYFRKKIQASYREPTYKDAKEKLWSIHEELEVLNRSAANSLKEGLEETLTIHRLEIYKYFDRSFTTTNCIENLNSQLTKYIRKVKRWMSSDQRYRWVVLGMMEAENRMRRVQNYKELGLLRDAIIKEINKKTGKQCAA
ncbi:MAG: IS256 family transposase [Bacteroidales bacterium]|nr:IS256 family transposase [Bacteroidales bacterium]